jgi:hypothetical protein
MRGGKFSERLRYIVDSARTMSTGQNIRNNISQALES